MTRDEAWKTVEYVEVQVAKVGGALPGWDVYVYPVDGQERIDDDAALHLAIHTEAELPNGVHETWFGWTRASLESRVPKVGGQPHPDPILTPTREFVSSVFSAVDAGSVAHIPTGKGPFTDAEWAARARDFS